MALTIKPASETALDVVSLGECMIRLSPPGHQRIELTPCFEAYAGGGEYNLTYALARRLAARAFADAGQYSWARRAERLEAVLTHAISRTA